MPTTKTENSEKKEGEEGNKSLIQRLQLLITVSASRSKF